MKWTWLQLSARDRRYCFVISEIPISVFTTYFKVRWNENFFVVSVNLFKCVCYKRVVSLYSSVDLKVHLFLFLYTLHEKECYFLFNKVLQFLIIFRNYVILCGCCNYDVWEQWKVQRVIYQSSVRILTCLIKGAWSRLWVKIIFPLLLLTMLQ